MPLDPVIASGFRGLELQNPLEVYARVNQLQQLQQQNQLNALKMDEYQRGLQEQNALRTFIPKLTPQNRSELLGYGAAGRQAYEALLKGEKESREADKAAADIAATRMKEARNLLPSVTTPEAYANWRAYTLQNLPGLANVIPDQYSPETVRGLMMEADKALEQHFVSQNLGGAQQVVGMPKYGQGPARIVPGSYAPEVPLPPAVAAQKTGIAKAGAPAVDVKVASYVPASETAQREYIDAARKERETLRNAPDTLKNIDAAKALIPSASAFMGKGGEPLLNAASFLNNRLGFSINTQGVTDATVLRTRLFEGILDNLKKLDSQPSQEQQRVLAEALGNLGTDPQALVQILDRIGETVRDRVGRYNMDVSDAEGRGVKFPFKPQISLPEAPRKASPIPGAAPAAGKAAQPIYARNPTTNERIMSVDGGATWTPAPAR